MNEELLRCDAIDSKPVDIDWREALGEDLEGFTFWESAECSECEKELVTHNGHCPVCGESCTEGPMMNYFYPVVIHNCELAAQRIAHLPLCVVELRDGQTGLALTGGGMDLSWEICEAFIALGFYPPAHFASLPRMGSRGESESDKETIAICRESLKIAASWASNAVQRLDEDFPR